MKQNLDYVSNTLSDTFPDGLDVNFSFKALEYAYLNAKSFTKENMLHPI